MFFNNDERNTTMDNYNMWADESDPNDRDYNASDESDESVESEENDECDENEDGIEEVDNEAREKELAAADDLNEDEIMDRFELNVEESVAQFVDEIITPRNTIPDSSDSEDEGCNRRIRKIRRSIYSTIELGKTFLNGIGFKDAIVDYALSSGKNIKQCRWDMDKLAFKCADSKSNCLWRVYCSLDRTKQLWIVKTSTGCHTCVNNGQCELLKSHVIGRLFMDKIREAEDFFPRHIQRHIKDQWKFVTTRSQCQLGRNLARRWIQKENSEQFSHLRGYCKEIQESNPRTTVVVDTIPNSKGEDEFVRFYVCYDILRTTWRGSFRPIIGVDGAFLKVAVKGVLLAAVGHDANNQIYPIAWAVVQSETIDNWIWFINMLKTDLMLGDGSGFVIISDRCTGLISAVKSELPHVEHRKCVKHIVENLKKKHSKTDMLKPLVWQLAWSYNETEYMENLRNMRRHSNDLYEDVMKENPKIWCRAFFRHGSFCEDVDNNATESFNSTITKARTKPMIQMLETIRRQAMQRVAKRSKVAEKHKGKHTMYAYTILEEEKINAEKCIIYRGTHGKYEAELHNNSYKVNLPKNTCSCCKWQVSGIPCEHAYGVVMDARLDIEDYISGFFTTFLWRQTYDKAINPQRGPRSWIPLTDRLIVRPPKPILPRNTKEPKNFPRKKGKHESPKKKNVEKLGKVGCIMHCSYCHEPGHNTRGCERKKQDLRGQFGTSASEDTIALTQPSQST